MLISFLILNSVYSKFNFIVIQTYLRYIILSIELNNINFSLLKRVSVRVNVIYVHYELNKKINHGISSK